MQATNSESVIPMKTLLVRNFYAIDVNLLCEKINDHHLIDICNGDHACVAVDNYNSTLSLILDELAPVKSRTVKMRPTTGWINDEVLQTK